MRKQRQRVASYALLHKAGSILLCRLSKEVPQWEGYWTLPGGGLNFGESPENAVVREVEEETGLIIKTQTVATIDSIYNAAGEEEFHGIRIIYQARVLGGTLRHEASGSTDRCEWHPLHYAPSLKLVDLAEVGVRVAQGLWPGVPCVRH